MRRIQLCALAILSSTACQVVAYLAHELADDAEDVAEPEPAREPAPAAAVPSPEEPELPNAWMREKNVDSASGNVIRSGLTKTVASSPAGMLVLLSGPAGQQVRVTSIARSIRCGVPPDCRISVRFDDDPPQTFAGAGVDDNTMSLQPALEFMKRAAKAKTIEIELTLEQEGTRVFEFHAPVVAASPVHGGSEP